MPPNILLATITLALLWQATAARTSEYWVDGRAVKWEDNPALEDSDRPSIEKRDNPGTLNFKFRWG